MPTVKARGGEVAIAEPDDTQLIPTDGAVLATDVYLPHSLSKTAFPTLLLRTPYGRRGVIDKVAELTAYFREAGYATVVQDVRGRYESSGELTPFRHEHTDGWATAEWVSAQPWSNGEIFPFGDSYAGFTSWATAATNHRSVRAAVVRVTTPEIGEQWMYRQGVFRLQMNAEWAGFAWGGPETSEAQLDWSVRPLRDIDFGGADMTTLLTWLKAGADAQEWRSLVGETASRWPATGTPILHWGGWWDLMARGQISAWEHLRAQGASGQRLLMGASDHSFNRFPPTNGGGLSLESQYEQVAQFLAAANRDTLKSGARWELTHGDWSESDSWPPANDMRRLYLADAASALFGPEGGALSPRSESVASTLIWQDNARDLVPSLETFVWATLASDYPDEREAHARDDVVTFTADPVLEPLDIAGSIRLKLDLEASRDVAQVVASLSDVSPDGTAWRISEGATRVRHGTTVAVDLGPLAYRVKPGHRLRVAVAASAFPRYMWACDDLVRAWNGERGADCELALRVGVDSYLDLPVDQKGKGS